MKVDAPQTQQQLMQRANAMVGKCLGQLAQNLPQDFQHNKGWVGQLLELHLGATAGSLSEPDFQQLGIELKTIPVSIQGNPKESTFVCSIDLLTISKQTWQTSDVYKKLNHVLWVPIEADKDIAIPDRKIRQPILWQPNEKQSAVLRSDWEELVEMITLGELEYITARHGEVLQIRPKAANARSLSKGINEFGQNIQTLPRGFYLRSRFTAEILAS